MLRIVCFHESGHAIGAESLGYPVTEVWADARRGLTLHEPAHDERHQLVITFCGTLAQWRAVPRSPLTISDDFQRVSAIVDRHGPAADRMWHEHLRAAERLVAAHWPAIERVAAALLARGRLSGDEIRRACRRV